MLDALKSTLMIGTPIHSEEAIWPFLLAAALTAAAVLSRVGRD
jgi:hypothetical protein